MNILITGGAGFIGSQLCEELLKSDRHQVFCLDNFNDFYDPHIKRTNLGYSLQQNHFTLFEEDIMDFDRLKGLFEQYSFDCIVHLAGEVSVRKSEPFQHQRINVTGTEHLLEMAKEFHVTNFIYGSSSSVYGKEKKLPFKESDSCQLPISAYGASKLSAERLCHVYHHLYSLNVMCLRYFSVYGPRMRPDQAIYQFAQALLEGTHLPLFGDGQSKRDFVYISDVVTGMVQALRLVEIQVDSVYSVYNIARGQMVLLQEVIKLLEDNTLRKATLQWLPYPESELQVTYADLEKSRRVLNYSPAVDIKEGIRLFFEWFSQPFV